MKYTEEERQEAKELSRRLEKKYISPKIIRDAHEWISRVYSGTATPKEFAEYQDMVILGSSTEFFNPNPSKLKQDFEDLKKPENKEFLRLAKEWHDKLETNYKKNIAK